MANFDYCTLKGFDVAVAAEKTVEEEASSLARVRGLLKCVELATSCGAWERAILNTEYGAIVMDSMYSNLKECFNILVKRAPGLGYSLPSLEYGDSYDRVSTFQAAFSVCRHFLADVEGILLGELEEQTGCSRSSLKAIKLI